jgi:hypothetical protein
MTRFDLLNRAITAAALIVLAATLGIWLARVPLTTAPVAAPVKIAPEPILAPPPPPPTMTPTVIEVPVEVEIAAVAEPPVIKLAEPTPESKPTDPRRRRGLFRRR